MCASLDDREKRNLSSGKSTRPEVCTKVGLCLLPPPLEKKAVVHLQIDTLFSRTPGHPPVTFQTGDFPKRCWMSAGVSQRRSVPEGVGLFSETD